MRLVIGIALFGVGLVLLLGQIEGTSGAGYPAETSWVRTAQGWERVDLWEASSVGPARLHPLIVASGQVLVSLLALVATSPRCNLPPRRLWRMAWTGH